MKIGIIKEGKTPPDKRTPFVPSHCKELKKQYPELEILVQSSPIRCFSDQEYADAGAQLVDDVSNCDIIFGVKEVRYDMLAQGKTMLFFSHTIKKQAQNKTLLQDVLKKNVRLIDYETLTFKNGVRVLGFGRYAGIVGSYNALMAFGKRNGTFDLKPAHLCNDMNEMTVEMQKMNLPNIKIIISGGGKVANGTKETMKAAGITEVSSSDFLTTQFSMPVYCNVDLLDYHQFNGKPPADLQEFIKDSTIWTNTFKRFTEVADIYISAHFWDNRSAQFFTKKDVASPEFKVKVIADITCDINGSVPTTIRSTTIEDPVFGYDRATGTETAPYDPESITIMAVDNLPCEVPKDASTGFGQDLIDRIIPLFLGNDPDHILQRATISEDGQLTERFKYLQDYVDGNGLSERNP